MPRRIELDPTPALLVGVLVLGLVIQLALPPAAPLTELSPARSPAGSAGAVRLTAMGAGYGAATSPAYAAILGRPLFSPTRSGATAALADAAPVGALALLGVASDGGRASATLSLAGAAPRSLRLGEAIAGWRLSGVGRDHAILSGDGRVQVLTVGAPPQAPVGATLIAPGGAALR